MLKFTISYLKYHRYLTFLFLVLVIVTMCILTLYNLLISITSMSLIPIIDYLKSMGDLVPNSAFDYEEIVNRLSDMYFSTFDKRQLCTIIFAIISVFFIFIKNIINSKDVIDWQLAGGSVKKWIWLHLLSIALPILIVFLLLLFWLLLAYPFLDRIYVVTKLTAFDGVLNERVNYISINQFGYLTSVDDVLVPIHDSVHKLFASMELSRIQLISYIVKSLVKSVMTIFPIVVGIDLTFSVILSCWRRYLNV